MQSDSGKFGEYGEILHVAKHEFGQVPGPCGLYPGDFDGLAGVPKGSCRDLNAYYMFDRMYFSVMCNHHGPVTNNDTEMLVLAFSENRRQGFQPDKMRKELSRVRERRLTMISCFGDSNTYGYDPINFMCRYMDEDRWPEILAGLAGVQTDNLGINGREIPHTDIAYRNAAAQITEEGIPELIIIMLGTNDKYIMPDSTPEKIADRMDLFLTDLQSRLPGIPIFLISPPGMGFGPYYEKVAEKHGTAFTDADGWDLEFAYDGVHFTPEANRVFARNVFEELKEKGFLHE